MEDYTIPLSGDGWYMIVGYTDPTQASVVNGTIGAIYCFSERSGYQRVLASDQLVQGMAIGY